MNCRMPATINLFKKKIEPREKWFFSILFYNAVYYYYYPNRSVFTPLGIISLFFFLHQNYGGSPVSFSADFKTTLTISTPSRKKKKEKKREKKRKKLNK